MLTGRGVNRTGCGCKDLQSKKGIIRVVMDPNWIFNTASSFN